MISLKTLKGITQNAESEAALLDSYNSVGTRRYEVRIHNNGQKVLWDRIEARKVGNIEEKK